jgi:hypothetical protein
MKGGILILAVIKIPFINPHTPPADRAIRIAKGIFTPFLRANAPIMALKARTDPTDKSIPPVMITHVIPTDTIPIIDTCLSMFNIFDSVRKCGDNIDNSNPRKTNPMDTMKGRLSIIFLTKIIKKIFLANSFLMLLQQNGVT